MNIAVSSVIAVHLSFISKSSRLCVNVPILQVIHFLLLMNPQIIPVLVLVACVEVMICMCYAVLTWKLYLNTHSLWLIKCISLLHWSSIGNFLATQIKIFWEFFHLYNTQPSIFFYLKSIKTLLIELLFQFSYTTRYKYSTS